MNFDIIALIESRIKKNSVSPVNIELENFSTEHTPTEIAAGGALLYINKRLSYHPTSDLNIYTPGKLESIFIEIVCPKSSNIIVGCIYKHPSLQVNRFTNDIILSLLGKLNKENSKKIFLLADSNIDLLQYETSEPVNNFVDTFSSNLLSPIILLPTRISNFSSTLIDNISCNVTFNSNIISGNFTSAVSDHLPQFAVTEDFFANSPKFKSNIFKRNWKHFDQNLFISDFENANWDEIIDVNKENVNLSLSNYLYNIDVLLEKHAPLKRLNKQDIEFQQKSWITQDLPISIKKRTLFFQIY